MKVRTIVNRVLAHLLVVIMAIMVLNVLWQVFSRYFLGSPSSFTDELARYLLIWIGILGAAYVSGQNRHIAIDIIPSRLSERSRKSMKMLVRAAIILFCFFALVVGGSRLVYITYVLKQFSPALGVPLACVYAVIPLSGLIIIYYKIADFLQE